MVGKRAGTSSTLWEAWYYC
uniref:Uncharacterized protein n=1 Tax=Arundo donax TaxID=35708 RepID=A0A0A9SNV8_ARUDO